MQYMLTLHLQDSNVQYFAVTREFNVCPGLSCTLPVLVTPTEETLAMPPHRVVAEAQKAPLQKGKFKITH